MHSCFKLVAEEYARSELSVTFRLINRRKAKNRAKPRPLKKVPRTFFRARTFKSFLQSIKLKQERTLVHSCFKLVAEEGLEPTTFGL